VTLRAAVDPSPRGRRLLTRSVQALLVAFVGVGVVRGSTGVVVNALAALGVTFLPALLEREYGLPMDAGLTLWISATVFLHALGVLGVPGVTGNLYAADSPIPFYDGLTHALSASVVAAVGYTVARAVDEHTDAVELPPRFTFVFVLLFVIAFGVFWEVMEFAVGTLAAGVGGDVLTQYGLADTIRDLVFDIVGGVVVATWGTAHLTDVAGAVSRRVGARREEG